MGDLRFNGEKYEVKTCELDGKTITYRAFEGIEYCEKPVDEIQKLNIFVLEEFYEKGEVNGYTLKTVPIFMPNSVGGYMAGSASEPGKNCLGIINAEFEALRHGYVVVCAGIRGRNSGMATNEFFVGGKAGNDTKKEGRLVGRAPALIVDMKAAIRYLRHNRDVIPGDVEKLLQVEPQQEELCLLLPEQQVIVKTMSHFLRLYAQQMRGMIFLLQTAIVRFTIWTMPTPHMNGCLIKSI